MGSPPLGRASTNGGQRPDDWTGRVGQRARARWQRSFITILVATIGTVASSQTASAHPVYKGGVQVGDATGQYVTKPAPLFCGGPLMNRRVYVGRVDPVPVNGIFNVYRYISRCQFAPGGAEAYAGRVVPTPYRTHFQLETRMEFVWMHRPWSSTSPIRWGINNRLLWDFQGYGLGATLGTVDAPVIDSSIPTVAAGAILLVMRGPSD